MFHCCKLWTCPAVGMALSMLDVEQKSYVARLWIDLLLYCHFNGVLLSFLECRYNGVILSLLCCCYSDVIISLL